MGLAVLGRSCWLVPNFFSPKIKIINKKYSPPVGVRLFIQFFVYSKHTRIRTIVHFYLGPLNGAWGNNIAKAVKPRQTLNLHE